MNRILGIASAMLLILFVLVPTAAAADPFEDDEHVLFNTGGDMTLAANQTVDLLIIIGGTATIEGEAMAVLVVEGTANFIGTHTDGVMAIQSHVTLDPTTTVGGDVATINSTVDRAPGASIAGTIRDVGPDLAVGQVLIGSALFLLYLAFVISAVMAGLVASAVAARQVREAGELIRREPLMTLLSGFVGIFGIVGIGVVAIVTVVGAPLGLGILVLVLPILFVVGYLVAGIWIGDQILSRISPGRTRERPYLAAILGLFIAGAIGLVPVLGGLVAFVGFGAVVLLIWRVVRGTRSGRGAAQPAIAPAAA
jgi:hypothetical protein